MKKELIQIFALPAKATDAEVIAEARRCAEVAASTAIEADEKRIVNQLISESCGALNAKTARQVIKNRGMASFRKPRS